jgi:ABC-type sugar transport system substrate-binding protein
MVGAAPDLGCTVMVQADEFKANLAEGAASMSSKDPLVRLKDDIVDRPWSLAAQIDRIELSG